ncbi:K02A2.6-like [Cordylochernes scorpioides]|uniref:RNA-directed DNA polymerase n=1 Tax=Cordylochernes scorpioides TaxID=51811 RepID=A0ABY6LB63_9ARAC|nr:K02A2.6-like [Cordylochernes scorpioides]
MPIFVSLLDSEMLKLGNDLFFPSTMREQPYELLVQRIKLHLAPRKKVIPQRCRFLKRIQLENESVSEYLRELRHLAIYCTFGEMLEVMLRDRFVAGIKSESLQKKLLQEDDDVTLDRVFSIAVSFELAEQNAKELQDGLVAKMDIVPGGNRKNEARRGWQHGPGMQRRETICFRCGEKNSHLAPACPHETKSCFKCRRIGHLSRVCKTGKSVPDFGYAQDELIYSVQGDTDAKINLHVDEYQLCFVVDTGSPVTLIPKTIYEKYWKDGKLSPSYLRLRSFCGNPIKIVGERRVFVKEANQDLRLIVVDEDISIFLLGREWLKGLNLDFSRLLNIRQARSLPFSLKKKVENEIDGMVNEGILQPIEYANWAAPIVPVLKKDGSLRICGDFRCTANKAIELDKYPLPSIDEIFSKLSGNTVFSSLDLSRAYLQVRLSEEAKRVVNINTTKGLFAFKRLPYGVAVAPNKFQREMDNLFADMSGVACYIDDILVAGKDHRDHEQKLELVFKRLQEKGLRLNKDKCKFAVNAVEYLGFKIDKKKGLHPISSKIEAVVEAPEPTNVSQLRSFIGLLMYYSRFIRNIADILAPFYHLLKNNSKWNWTGEHRILFAKCKALLTNESVLAHYDATRELVLACDASSYGLGVVLSHRNDRKEETPIAFASRTLTEAERRYSQLEKEALSIIFGCEKFRQYLLGREFVLITDNRPLMHIFSPQKPIPICAASRIKRWSLKLSAFKYTVEFRKTYDNGNADALSRLPLVSKTTESLDEDQVLLLRKRSEVPFSFQDVAFETRRDKLLSIVLRNVRENNWQIPKVSQENPLYSYYRIKDELSCEFGCLQWRERVVIPQKLRSLILNDLHEMHLGMVKMKMIARRYFWWPGIDKNIEELARDCRICQESASMPPSTISEWTWPEKPWHRLHLDLAGSFMGRMFMVLVDAYTKWLEIVIIKDITSRTIIGHLREIFARFGLPELLVTDNGRQFVSSEFEEFTKINSIRHTKTSPYNPSTNGLAERYRFLFAHRAFPQTVLKESPAELLMKRNLRSRFSNLIPKMAKVGEVYHDAMRKQKHFAVGSDVYFRNFANGPKWKRGRIMELLSSRHYLIEDEGRYVKRHINQLRTVIKKEVPEVRDLVLPGTSRDFILPGTSRDHPGLGGQEKTREEAPEVDEELKGAESSAQEDTPEPEPGPAAAAVPVPVPRLEQFLILEEASEEKKKAYLLTLIGGKAYDTLKNVCSPKLPKEYKYEELIENLVEYFSPRRSIIVERFMFFGRIQKETESVSEYLVEIKRLASTCGFGEFLKESLRDKLVCGLRDAKIQRRILSEGDVPLARVVEIALSMEAAEKNTRIFHVNEPADSVDKIRAEVRNRYDRVQKRKCIHCGRLHKDLCRFREATCFRCGKRGHLATICRSRGEHTSEKQVSRFLNQRKINQIEDQEEEEEESVQRMVFMRTYDYRVKYATNDPPYVIKVRVEDTLMTFEIDTGSCLTSISEKDFKRYLPDVQVKEAGIIVKTYDGIVVPILGEIDVKVDFRRTIAKLRAIVVRGERKALLGREWINVLKIGNYFVNQMPLEDTLAELLSEHQVVFGETTDPIKGFTFAVNIQDVNPIFHKARPVPFAIRTAVNEVLERMVEKDYLYQVPSSKWATSVVVVPKKNKEFRICCDFKVTLNRFLDTAAYPLPTQQDLFSVLARGKYFSKLDLSNAYLQLEKHNIKLKREKCEYLRREIQYLGHLIKEDGIRPLEDKIQGLQKAKSPTNVSELRSFLGLVNYYGKFIPNLPELLEPLHKLLKKNSYWKWTGECEEAISECKKRITSDRVLVPYDATLPLSLATDASQIGVGAVLSHVIEGQEKPIMFASRTLSGAERNYSQIEREALAIIYGVTKFHQFIYGRQFTLITDHKPLVSILGPRAGIPTLSTSRLQRWGLTLAAYTYEIKFRRTQDHGNADLLSRLPVESDEKPVLNQTFILSYVEDLPVTAAEIGVETKKDEVLSVVKRYTQQGWPERVGEYLRPYFQRKLELTMDGECLLCVWGMRVIIPSSLRKNMLSCLHETHSGMGKMKAVARSHFWWPNLDNQIECMVNGCKNCQQTQTGPSKVNWRPWVWATKPWQRIHMDFAFKDGVNLLIVVDSHSKWVEAIPMREITARKTIEQLRRLFSAYGLPEEVVSDNGPQFTGSNDLAERAVQLIKMALEKNKRKFEDTIQDTLSRILLTYRCTPHETTGKTPSELFMGRSLRTRLTLIHQSLDNRVRERQARQMRYDRGRGQEEFEVDDKVWCKNFRGVGWIPGRIVGRKGSRVYTVLINGQVKTYHRDQIWRRWTSGEDGDEAREKKEEEDDPIWMAPESMNSRRDRESFSSETAGLPQDPVSGDQGVEIESSPRESACSSDREARTEERPLPRRNPPRDWRPPLAAVLAQTRSSERTEAELPPFDGSYSARQFFQSYDRKMDDAHVDAPDKLLRLPNYLTRQPLELFRKLRLATQSYFRVRQTLTDLYPESSEASFAKYFAMKLAGQADLETYYREKTAMGLQLGLPQEVILETLTEGLPLSDQRLVRVVPPESLGEWFRLAQRIHGPNVPTARHREEQPPTMSGPYPSTPRRTGAWTAPTPPSNCKFCGARHWHSECRYRPAPTQHANARAVQTAPTQHANARAVQTAPIQQHARCPTPPPHAEDVQAAQAFRK